MSDISIIASIGSLDMLNERLPSSAMSNFEDNEKVTKQTKSQ